MKRLFLLAFLLSGAANAQLFDEPSARAACERDATKHGVAENLRGPVVDACVGAQRGDLVQIEHKKTLLPPWVYPRCVAANADPERVNQCLDDAAASLPRGSVNGIWRLQKGLDERIFWDFADCNSERLRTQGSVCVN